MTIIDNRLRKYAQAITQVGANVQPGQRVWINCSTDSLPLTRLVVEEAYKLGASDVHVKLTDDAITRLHAEYKTTEYYSELPQHVIDEINFYLDDNVVLIRINSSAPDLLTGIDSEKLAAAAKVTGEKMTYYRSRVMSDKNSWTIAAYPSPAWAKLVFPDEPDEETAVAKLLDAMLEATRINVEDPVKEWQEHRTRLSEKATYLNDKHYKALHYTAEGTDLTIELPKTHLWIAAGGYNEKGTTFVPNMPTEEVFTAAEKTGVNGYVSNKKPLSYQGNIIDGFKLHFKDGAVVDFECEQGYDVLKNLLEMDEGSRFLGEVALVPHDSPISNSGLLFFNTLYDENAANHVALGAAYPTNIDGGGDMTPEEVAAAGINQSAAHVDFMIGCADMDIDGILEDGTREPVFRNGNWAF
ncbi:aminopeptidase [Streptococcus merionis]|uniref:aminopeptidase n=1 Tax=Streptococcus merionis TaxID=400065 RepID=UPI003510FC95